ncbi:hypothetical protein A8C56_12140 [Niabella ginsenosidivorans]|uniref:DUF5689 domain-containing protein n=1 Tax=Niabella ginsenosidivorans TaxID=1176587 RepID=A0A1A9I3J9_9BACT|nr:BACON domain-containing protein [Niabella ginsenosidivorans]ANH81629.1 hypothetical protein A8C56_12140 [Niabella ginsenosidivorans]
MNFRNNKPVTAFVTALFCLLLFAALSCKRDNGDLVRFSELGAVSKEYTVPQEAGQVAIQVYTNDKVQLSLANDSSAWIHLDSVGTITGDSTFTVRYDANPGLPRMGKIVLYAQAAQRYDTVLIRQKGALDPVLQFVNTNASVLGKTDNTVETVLKTNIPLNQLKREVIYLDSAQGWVADDLKLTKDSLLSFTVKANPSQTQLRSAQLKLSYTDGWQVEHVATLYLLQSNAQNLFGTKASFTDVRAWAGGRIVSDIFIEGIVVSDKSSQNMGDIRQTTPTVIDYSSNNTTVYIESPDGNYGFKMLTATASDNIFTRYSRVQILLKGTSVELEQNPNRYTITGVTSSMVMSQVAGSDADLPKKEKTMAALTDDDIYTYTTLTDCELPIRKGPLTPVNEGYTILYNANRTTKYPLLMRDRNGASMFLLTNMTCPYRRDGSMLPYGSGKISGIVVHELFPRFEYEDAPDESDYGNIGRYQLRHVSKSDLQLAVDFSNSFSGLLVEYQYPKITDGVAYPTNGSNGSLRSSAGSAITLTGDWSYLGLCGAANLGNTNPLGNGVLLPDGTRQNTAGTTNSDGKGAASNAALNTACVWWNNEKNRGEAWILQLSTAGISTDRLSLQFTALNRPGSGAGTPRFWRVDWSDTGDMDGEWHTVAYYTVPDVAYYSNTLYHQLAAYKNINIPLPLSLLGKPNVYIRLIVDKNLCSTGNTYATAPITQSIGSSIGYLAVRYNK